MCHVTEAGWPCCARIDVVNVDMCTGARAWARTGATSVFPCRKKTKVADMGGWCWRCEAEITARLEEVWKAQERAEMEAAEGKGPEEGEGVENEEQEEGPEAETKEKDEE